MPTIRNSRFSSSVSTGLTVNFPTGSVAGDLAVLMVNAGYEQNLPYGWFIAPDGYKTTVWWCCSVWYKVLTSADISTGSVALTNNLATNFDFNAYITTFVGGTPYSVGYVAASANPSPTSTSVTLATTHAVQSTDTLLYMGSNRSTGATTCSAGSLILQNSNTNSTCALYSDTGVSGIVSRNFLCASTGNGNAQAIVQVSNGYQSPVPVGSALASGIVGTAYSETLSTPYGTSPFTYSVTSGSLPGGLSLSGATISGTPTTAGTSTFTIQVTDTNSLIGSQAFSITVASSGGGGGAGGSFAFLG